ASSPRPAGSASPARRTRAGGWPRPSGAG
ncbi:MAG: hypothetical protein AVDCRST_MAG54-599, partial [uncultured Actinomycetospora sp.]